MNDDGCPTEVAEVLQSSCLVRSVPAAFAAVQTRALVDAPGQSSGTYGTSGSAPSQRPPPPLQTVRTGPGVWVSLLHCLPPPNQNSARRLSPPRACVGLMRPHDPCVSCRPAHTHTHTPLRLPRPVSVPGGPRSPGGLRDVRRAVRPGAALPRPELADVRCGQRGGFAGGPASSPPPVHARPLPLPIVAVFQVGWPHIGLRRRDCQVRRPTGRSTGLSPGPQVGSNPPIAFVHRRLAAPPFSPFFQTPKTWFGEVVSSVAVSAQPRMCNHHTTPPWAVAWDRD